MARTILRRRTGDIVTALQLADRTGIVAASAPPAAEEQAVALQPAMAQPAMALGRVTGSQLIAGAQPGAVEHGPRAGARPSAGPRSQLGGSELVVGLPSTGSESLGWGQRSRGVGDEAVSGSQPEPVGADAAAGAAPTVPGAIAGSEAASVEAGPVAGSEPVVPGKPARSQSVAGADVGQGGVELVARAHSAGPELLAGARGVGTPSRLIAVPGAQVATGAQSAAGARAVAGRWWGGVPSTFVAVTEPQRPVTRRVRRNLVFAGAAVLFLVAGWIGGGVWGHLDQEPVPVLASGAAPGQAGNREAPPAPVVEPAPVVSAPTAAPPVTNTKPAAATTKRAPKTTSKTSSASPNARADSGTVTQNPVAILLSQQWTQFGTSWPQSGTKNRGGYPYWGFGR